MLSRREVIATAILFSAALSLWTPLGPAAPVVILPLTALLWFLARERRNRAAQAATLRVILQHASDLILIAERDGRLRRVYGASATLLGEAEGGRLVDHVHPEDVPAVLHFLAAGHGEAEFRLVHVDGTVRHVHAVAADLSGDARVRGLVLTIRDDEARQALRHRAWHDPLTGLANRALFEERLAEADAPAVLFVDLDAFKPINDRFGHAAGDEVLRIVARRLQTCVRATDTVARLGGDEFALLVEAGSQLEIAERVADAFVDPFNVVGELLVVTASVGVAVGGEDVLGAADRAMYEVKRAQQERLRATS
jgi:diguanylate cyclase (GGDEF)-like protein